MSIKSFFQKFLNKESSVSSEPVSNKTFESPEIDAAIENIMSEVKNKTHDIGSIIEVKYTDMFNPLENDDYVVVIFRVLSQNEDTIAFVSKESLKDDDQTKTMEFFYPAMIKNGLSEEGNVEYMIVPHNGEVTFLQKEDLTSIQWPVKARPAYLYSDLIRQYIERQNYFNKFDKYKFNIEVIASEEHLTPEQLSAVSRYVPNPNSIN